MAKYFINEDNLSSDNVWRAAIANELAEANRLKRLELSIYQKQPINENAIPTNAVFPIHELEDQT